MKEFVECEIKLKVPDRGLLEKVMKELTSQAGIVDGEQHVENLETTYFDTADSRLRQNKLVYRIRKSNAGFTADIKNEGTYDDGVSFRNEWSRALESDTPDIGAFADLHLEYDLAEILSGEELVPILKTSFKRTSAMVTAPDGSVYELAADRGFITAGDRKEELCELELELKSGAVSKLREAAEVCCSKYGLEHEEKSKYLRGLILAGILRE